MVAIPIFVLNANATATTDSGGCRDRQKPVNCDRRTFLKNVSNITTSVVLSDRIGMQLKPSETRTIVLNAFRYALYERVDIERTTVFLCERVREIDLETKHQIASEINNRLSIDPHFSDADVERWAIVARMFSRSGSSL